MAPNDASRLAHAVRQFLAFLVALFAMGCPAASPAKAIIEPIYTLPFYDSYSIACGFGCYLNPDGSPHAGTDYEIGAQGVGGESVVAAANATAKPCPYEDDGAGNYIVLDHGNGHRTRYLHLISPAIPANGASLLRGQLIGYEGSTGYTDPEGFNHLHFETRVDADTFTCGKDGTAVDPYAQAFWLWTVPYPGPPAYPCTVAPTPPYPDGSLFKEEHGTAIYVIYGNTKYWIHSSNDFEAMGFSWAAVICVPDNFLGSISDTPEEETLIMEFNTAPIYVFDCRAKMQVPRPEDVALLISNQYAHPSAPYVIPPGEMARFGTSPQEGCHIKQHTAPEQYLMCGASAQKWHIPHEYALGRLHLDADTLRTLWDYANPLSQYTTFTNLTSGPCAQSEGDAYSNLAETYVGTDPGDECGGSGPPSSAWPSDFMWGGVPYSTNRITITDVTSFSAPVRRLDTSPGDPG